jgi:hypothetical protein
MAPVCVPLHSSRESSDEVRRATRLRLSRRRARKLVEIANDVEAVQDGRIFIERVNAPFLAAGGNGKEFRTGIERAIALGWLWRHDLCEVQGR